MTEDPKTSPEESGNDGSGDPEPTKDEEKQTPESDKGEEKESEKKPDEKSEGESESKESEKTPEKKEEPTVDELIAQREDLRRRIQSDSDTAVSNADKRRKQEERRHREEERVKVEEEEFEDLAEGEEFEKIGRGAVDKRRKEKLLGEARDSLAADLVTQLQTQYDASLGEEAVNRITEEVRQAGTGV
ncbi:hypothetical protein LCGC14_2453010, partial [marine sediment metagenome]